MWPYPKIIAHRGGGSLAPENTLAAMQCGFDYGFRAVEFDVMLSKDGIPVLMHDPEFGRTVAGHGEVSATLMKDLIEMDAGSWFDPRFSNERVPSYEEVFFFCQEHAIWMNVEIKPAPGFDEQTGETVAKLTRKLLQQLGDQASVPLFSSFSYAALMSAKLHAAEIPRAYLLDDYHEDWLSRLQELEARALHTNQKHLNPIWARQIKEASYGLFCYTVNSPERGREILNWGVDAFCTDRIDLIPANFAD